MAASPTEVLAADVDQLRDSDRRLSDEVKGLAASVNRLHSDLYGFERSVEKELKFIRWVGVFFAVTLVAVVGGSGRVVWDAATITAEVKHQGVRLDKVDQRLDKMEQQLGHQATNLNKVEQRLDKVEQQLGQQATSLNQVNQQLGLILQRLDQVVPKKGGG
jgi:predicted  nucleic acid-binding Zn-ribbon protein